MNQEDNKHRLISILLYIILTLLIIGYSLVRLGTQRSITIETLFGFVGYAGYILAGWYLLMKSLHKTAWIEMSTIGLAISITHSITLLMKSPFFSNPIIISKDPFVTGYVSLLCFLVAVVLVVLLIGFIGRFIQTKAPQWLPNAQSWAVFLVLWNSILFVVLKHQFSWKSWYGFRQTVQGDNLTAFLPPVGIVICVYMIAVSLLFVVNVVRNAFRDSS